MIKDIVREKNIEKICVMAKTKSHLQDICVASRNCQLKILKRKWLFFIPYEIAYYDLPEDYSFLEEEYEKFSKNKNYVSVNIVGISEDTSDKFTYAPSQSYILK